MLRSTLTLATVLAAVSTTGLSAHAAGYVHITPSMISLNGIPSSKPVVDMGEGASAPVVETRKVDNAGVRSARSERANGSTRTPRAARPSAPARPVEPMPERAAGSAIEPKPVAPPNVNMAPPLGATDRGGVVVAPQEAAAPPPPGTVESKPTGVAPNDPNAPDRALGVSDIADLKGSGDPALDAMDDLLEDELAELDDELDEALGELNGEDAEALRQRKALQQREQRRNAVTQAARN